LVFVLLFEHSVGQPSFLCRTIISSKYSKGIDRGVQIFHLGLVLVGSEQQAQLHLPMRLLYLDAGKDYSILCLFRSCTLNDRKIIFAPFIYLINLADYLPEQTKPSRS
jgi:hypothetical protein